MDPPEGPPVRDAFQQSATLPRDFIFHYTDGPGPKTPEPVERHSLAPEQPPPPPRMRVKRRRPLVTTNLHCDIPSSDFALPSIELSESGDVPSAKHGDPCSTPQAHLLSPSSPSLLARTLPPAPKTPLSQIRTSFDGPPSGRGPWAHTPNRRAAPLLATRPPSAWSELSDSSLSSLGSADTFSSLGECVSPDSDLDDPFTFPDTSRAAGSSATLASPMQLEQRRPGRRPRLEPEVEWTADMDEHLWLTYMKYMCDPTVTPFKTLPGSAPPLGVCYRVARKAKKTFRASRVQLTPIAEKRRQEEFASLESVMRRESSVPLEALMDSTDTLRPESLQRPHSTSGVRLKVSSRWSPSSRQTRARLRQLCKRKPTLSPHYQRLMQSRSPSPMESSSSHATIRSSRFTSPRPRSLNGDSFSTRELNFTLSTATASTMQPGNPLAQLSSGALTSDPMPVTPERPVSRGVPHQKSQSLQLGLGIARDDPGTNFKRLASPFEENYWQPLTDAGPSSSGNSTQDRVADAHLEIHHPRPMSGSMKRRAQCQLGEELLSDDPELRRSYLEDLFRDSGVAAGKRRVRSRGFSLGAVSHQPRQPSLSEVFTPPSNAEGIPGLPTPSLTLTQPGSLQPPTCLGASTRRLGSPFAPVQNSGLSNTFPRSLFPQGLDSISSLEQSQQHQQQPQPQRQQQQQHQHQQQQQHGLEDPFLSTPRQSDFSFSGLPTSPERRF